jgi:eukaryotic-like serine/threonine-protein kinase
VSLTAGARLGAFEIIGPLASGGMGEIYRARDLRLHRDVAIKVLPPATAADPQALARFEREALAVASLSHPNIVSIFEFGHEGAAVYAVMELLDGVTLRTRLANGPLTPAKAVEYGVAMAQGLAAAHERGVIHRDLTPENIFLTSDGRLKILDFGLVRRTRPPGALGTEIPLGRLAPGAPKTAPGLVIGTISYLSPEQARGREVDHRTDIFTVGAVLYEMITGRRAFAGPTPADVITAIVSTDPPPAHLVRPDVPATVDRVIHRCLEKAPDDRFQSARDLAFALDALRGTGPLLDAGSVPDPSRMRSGRAPARSFPRLLATAGLAGVLAGAAGVAGWWLHGQAPESDLRPVTFDIPIGRSTGLPPVAAISPDGRTVLVANVPTAGSEGRGAFLRPLASTEVTKVTSTLLTQAFWSPDGREIAAVDANRLRAMSIDSSSERALATLPNMVVGGTWGPDGIVVAVRGHGLMRVPSGGGTPAPVPGANPQAAWPQRLPDGRLLYWVPGTAAEPAGTIRLLENGVERLVISGAASAGRFVLPGYLFFGRNGQLLVQSVNAATLAPLGEPLPLARPLYQSVVAEGYPAFDVSPMGAVAFFPGFPEPMQFEWVGRRGETLGTTGPTDRYTSFDLAPDEQRILVIRRDQNTDTRSVRLIDSRTGIATEVLSSESGQISDPVWAPDGERMAVRVDRHTIVRPVLGGTDIVVLDEPGYPEHWSRDGRYLLLGRAGSGGQGSSQYRLSVVDLERDDQIVDVAEGVLPDEGRFSPDGKQIAYHVQVNGRPEVFVEPFPTTGARQQISPAGGVQPQWCNDGRELIYLSPDGQVMSVAMPGDPSAPPSMPRPLFDGRLLPSAQYDQIRVSRDCSRILLQRPAGDRGSQLRVIVNWTSLVRPAGAQ